ncbi:hypothetical protein ACT17_12020 [Mycolicibacterium conceptionense]|jgi:hypothetical protein|uniref:Uncharacterized protein n=1 Tax=Mycolicibacterium conceptionense TaxID=451644 RepID=A0A0J8U9W6_9MYCO|nr:hypothetical protein [Mycolicibacterium conceptionense]KMV18343.1 hypothetical protein ACT17_12020 [Mycolicibacterium conceptionense]
MTTKTSVSLDRHVVILNAAGTFTPNGFRLTGPVTSLDKLETLITYLVSKNLLRTFPANAGVDPAPARLWFVGDGGRLFVGATGDTSDEDVAAQIGPTLASLINRGWELKGGPEGRFVLTGNVAHPDAGPQHVSVEVVVEARPWIGGGTIIDDQVELGRRLTAWHTALGVLPASSAHGSGAVLLDDIRAARIARHPAKNDKSGEKTPPAVLTESGELLSGVDVDLRIQPAWAGTPGVVQQQQLDHAVDLALLEQQYPHLGSAGMISLGFGGPQRLRGHQATDAAAAAKRPFGMWRALLPAAETIKQPQWLPAPHPQIRPGEATRTWVSTEDLDNLAKDVMYGGANLSVDRLDIDAAVVWPYQVRLLEAWTKRLRDDALVAFAGNPALCALVEEVAREYTTVMGDPDAWTHEEWRHHYQPAHAASIATHIRYRGRRVAMRLSREYRAMPLYVHDAASIYALGIDEETKQPVDLSDKHTQLGRVEITRRVELADDTVVAVVLAETPAQVADVLTTALDVPAIHDELAAPTARADDTTQSVDAAPSDEAEADTSDSAEPAETVTDTTAATKPAESTTPPVPAKTGGSAARRKSAAPVAKRSAPAAAVLHTDGLWLPEGTCISTSKLGELAHVGHVANLAYTYNIGYPLSADYAEAGQIWVTEAACRQFGIDVTELAEARANSRVSLLHEMTENIPFVTDAVVDGWRLGGDKEVARLGAWTRVFRDDSDKTAVHVVLIAGLDTALTVDEEPVDDDDAEEDLDARKGVPILRGRPSPAQVARRLQLFADALDFPYKISDRVTGLDILEQARPRPSKDGKGWTVKDWKSIVLAPSTTELPYGLGDVERDYTVWCRVPTAEEQRCLYVHAYDRSGSYFAALGSVEMPIGDPVHYPGGTKFDPRLPGFWLVNIPENANRFMPHLLNPAGHYFTEPKWVTTDRLEMAFQLGYDLDIQEALVWPHHSRVLRLWAERFSHASVVLDTDDPDAQAARNQSKNVRNRGFGAMQSAKFMKDKQSYFPARWYMGVGKAGAVIAYRINDIGQTTGRWPVAVDHDSVLYVSNDPNPETAWPGGPATWGRSFGKYKHEGSAPLADQLEFLDGNTYRGKKHLTSPDRWREMLPTLTNGGQ